MFVPSSWKLTAMLDAACEKADADIASERAKARRLRAAGVGVDIDDNGDDARTRRMRRENERRILERLEHGCHPKPRHGGLDGMLR